MSKLVNTATIISRYFAVLIVAVVFQKCLRCVFDFICLFLLENANDGRPRPEIIML